MFTKNLQDANLEVSIAIPAANSSATSNFIDLLGSGPTDVSNVLVPERIELQVEIPALPNNVTSADAVVVTLVDSADGSTSAPIVGLAPISVPGVASTGTAFIKQNFRPPPTTRRYVGVTVAPATGSGDNTAASVKMRLAF